MENSLTRPDSGWEMKRKKEIGRKKVVNQKWHDATWNRARRTRSILERMEGGTNLKHRGSQEGEEGGQKKDSRNLARLGYTAREEDLLFFLAVRKSANLGEKGMNTKERGLRRWSASGKG